MSQYATLTEPLAFSASFSHSGASSWQWPQLCRQMLTNHRKFERCSSRKFRGVNATTFVVYGFSPATEASAASSAVAFKDAISLVRANPRVNGLAVLNERVEHLVNCHLRTEVGVNRRV